jgi:hypothetical protein
VLGIWKLFVICYLVLGILNILNTPLFTGVPVDFFNVFGGHNTG